jgi:hypothetical protein
MATSGSRPSVNVIGLQKPCFCQCRIQDARFPVINTMAGWDWNWPARINSIQIEHLLEVDFINTSTNVIFAGSTGTGKAI